jgi:hypothetical protein
LKVMPEFPVLHSRVGRWALSRTRAASGGPGPCSAGQEARATGPIRTAAHEAIVCRSRTRVPVGEFRRCGASRTQV